VLPQHQECQLKKRKGYSQLSILEKIALDYGSTLDLYVLTGDGCVVGGVGKERGTSGGGGRVATHGGRGILTLLEDTEAERIGRKYFTSLQVPQTAKGGS